LLNEDQAVFALTLSRNTPEVVQLKLDLTIAFKQAREQQPPVQMLEYARINKELMALFGIDGNMQTLALNNAMLQEFGVNLLETWDLNGLKSDHQQQTLTVSDIAKQLGIGTRQINPVLIEAELQTSHRDHKDRLYYELTDKGLEYAIYLDTGKKHNDGTPIRQIKWYDSVVEVLKGYLQRTASNSEL